MKKWATRIIRWMLSAALIYGVYTETGIWTAVNAILVLVALELVLGQLKQVALLRWKGKALAPMPGCHAGNFAAKAWTEYVSLDPSIRQPTQQGDE